MLCRTKIRRPHTTPVPFTVPQVCLLYKYPKLKPQRTGTIGIVSLGGGYKISDVEATFKTCSLPMPILSDLSVGGAVNTPGSDADAENVLDIVCSAGAYSYVTEAAPLVHVCFAPNTDDGFVQAVLKLIAAKVDGITISWVTPEKEFIPAAITALHNAFGLAQKNHIPVSAASGDNDSGDGEPDGSNTDYPSSDPLVIGCGGTRLTKDTETVWNDGVNGTGGGFSRLFPRPAWQANAPKNAMRMVPDVASNADPATGFQFTLDDNLVVIGGTSASAPLNMGLIVALKAAGKWNGVTPNVFWTTPKAFRDITVGNNNAFTAGVGPDPCTGMGSIIGEELVRLMNPTPSPEPTHTPPKMTSRPSLVNVHAINWGTLSTDVLMLMSGILNKLPIATMVLGVSKVLSDVGVHVAAMPRAAAESIDWTKLMMDATQLVLAVVSHAPITALVAAVEALLQDLGIQMPTA